MPRRTRTQLATALATVVLLFATSGLTLTRMSCLMSGRVVFSLQPMEDCCEHESSGASIAATCCAFAQVQLPQAELLRVKNEVPMALALCTPIVPVRVTLVTAQPPRAPKPERPPPLLASDRLAQLSVFRI